MGKNASRVIQSLKKNKHWGFLPEGVVLLDKNPTLNQKFEDLEVIGSLADIEEIIKQRQVDEVFFALDEFKTGEVEKAALLCEDLGIPARFSLSWFNFVHSKVMFSDLDGLPLVTFYTTLRTPLEVFFKRALDIIVSCVGVLITALLFPLISWRIKKESPGPVIFKQYRIGENGRQFKCYKFRTMYMDAEDRKKDLVAQNQMEGPLFKIDNDPRIFPFGNFLRKSSLDELPQFVNILRGDMSVVGTRPPTPDEVAKYKNKFRRRLSIRPGLTGLWQVSGRNKINKFEDVLELDLKYIDSWSIWLDIKIIFKTVGAVFTRKGAQ